MYGADMRDCEKIAQYLVEHYEVKNLVLNVYLDNGLEYDEESDRLTKNLHYKEDPDTSAPLVLHALSLRRPALRPRQAEGAAHRHHPAADLRRL